MNEGILSRFRIVQPVVIRLVIWVSLLLSFDKLGFALILYTSRKATRAAAS